MLSLPISSLIPERIQLSLAAVSDLHGRRMVRIDACPVLEHRHQNLTESECSRLDSRLLPCLDRIKDHKVLVLAERLLLKANEIRPDLSGFLVVNPVDLLVARVRDLLRVLGELDLRREFLIALVLDCSELVDTAEGRMTLRGDERRADAPGIDLRALLLQGLDEELIEVRGSTDRRVRKACVRERSRCGCRSASAECRLLSFP